MDIPVFVIKLVRYSVPLIKLMYDLYSDRRDRDVLTREEFLDTIHAAKLARDERRKRLMKKLKEEKND